MEDRRYNLDQPQNEKDYQCFVMLRKDKKRICRVKCSKPSSIAIPQIWDIAKYIKKDDLPSGLHSIHIHPAHEDAHQKTEWLLFLYFLKRHEKAAVANTDNCQWYIIPSSGDEDNSHAVVMYSMLEHAVPICQNNAKSGPTDCNYERTIGNEQARQSGVKTYSKYGCNAMVHSSYLKTLGQTHSEWIFGAVAEFVDNSRDAKATKLEISIDNIYWRIADKEIPMLAIVDDGHGMSHEEILAMVSIGRKQPETSDSNRIGRYGVGFKAYKRVGSMIHNGEKSHGIIGVIDVTDVMDEGSGRVWVHNNKQRFVDCEPYALLEHWLSKKADEYLDQNIDKVHVEKRGPKHKPDHEWVQCDKCRKWRILDSDFDSKTLPQEWFCYMKPFNGKCEMLEQNPKHGVITISSQRSGYNFKTLSERNNELEQSQTQGGYQISMSKGKHVSTAVTLPLKRRRGRPRKDSAKN